MDDETQQFYDYVSPSVSPIYGDQDTERPKSRGHDPLIAISARARKREEAARRALDIRCGIFPGYCASVQDLTRPGKWIAVVLLNRAPHRYVRKESIARFNTSDEAFDAAERWLKRETAR